MYRDDIKRAAETANLICGASHDSLRLAVAIIGNDLEQVRKAVPVYVVENANNPPCEVPYSHRVIVIDERFPFYLNKQFLQGGLIESTYMINSVDLLTVLLLHELGHLAHTDYKKDIAYRFSSVLNDEKTIMKEVEVQADEFAVVNTYCKAHQVPLFVVTPVPQQARQILPADGFGKRFFPKLKLY